MPIEIKELTIKTTVTPESQTYSDSKVLDEEAVDSLKDELKQMCKEMIEEYLEKKSRR